MAAEKRDLDGLNYAPREAFIAALADVFENSPWVAEAAAAQRPFATVAALHEAMLRAVLDQPREQQIRFLCGHPDLAGKAARSGDIGAASSTEQAGIGLDRLSEAEYATFHRLNTAYTSKFSFPFIACVRRLTLDALLASYEARLGNEEPTEITRAFEEIGHITRLRLIDIVPGPGAPQTTGHLSTHILDAYHGEPAAGVRIELFEIRGGSLIKIRDALTNTAGRTDEPLIHGEPLRAGRYELFFYAEAYFRRRSVPLPAIPFIGDAAVRFGIDQPEGRYHVPLVVTPWSSATYRGS
jgi:2-oxo-4-hydroxy-4-carboxy-5-ureidoimidazoline decarboxylase